MNFFDTFSYSKYNMGYMTIYNDNRTVLQKQFIDSTNPYAKMYFHLMKKNQIIINIK
jgi:hypothetical protein